MSGPSSPCFFIISRIIIHICLHLLLDFVFSVTLGWGPGKEEMCTQEVYRGKPLGATSEGGWRKEEEEEESWAVMQSQQRPQPIPWETLELVWPRRVVLPEARAPGLYTSTCWVVRHWMQLPLGGGMIFSEFTLFSRG